MIIVSNGHHKFITGMAAAEAYKNNVLAGFITAGYPTPKLRRLIIRLKLDRYAPIKRLLQRQENLPDVFVHSLWLSELIYGITRIIARQVPHFEADYGFQFYAWQAESIVRNLPGRIYHYRSGYGRDSVQIAKQKSMVALCDHSIAHPAALEYLILNGGKLPPLGQDGPINSLWRNILKDTDQADYLLVNSDFVKETFIHFGYDASRILVLYTGIDDRFLSLIPPRSYPSFTGRPIRLLFAGDMGARKGGRILLEALMRIRDLSWQFEAIGSIDPSLRNDFPDFFTDERVAVTGHLPWDELAEHMNMADIFVFPSLAEGSARIVFMAMACGCYVITTPNSGSVVQDEIHGKIVAPGDVDALEAALRESFLNQDRVPAVGRRNANLIKSRYTQSHYGNGLMTIYKMLMEHPAYLASVEKEAHSKKIEL
ncbi:MAG: glycosyltransferase family 4 protein [Methylobacter sp.]|nr:glycosyltransferase family 4 protein [Methylobacter sp.]